jgi:hypothetical protein
MRVRDAKRPRSDADASDVRRRPMSFLSKVKGLSLFALGAAAGAASQYFFDPVRGRSRRAQASDQLQAAARDGLDEARKKAEYQAGVAKGAALEAAGAGVDTAEDDRTLKHQVETRVLGREGMPKGAVVVHVEDGVVQLRGKVPQQSTIDDLVSATRSLQGVRDVQNLLHLPGEPEPSAAPSRAASDPSS